MLMAELTVLYSTCRLKVPSMQVSHLSPPTFGLQKHFADAYTTKMDLENFFVVIVFTSGPIWSWKVENYHISNEHMKYLKQLVGFCCEKSQCGKKSAKDLFITNLSPSKLYVSSPWSV
jgi:hypothetical protein